MLCCSLLSFPPGTLPAFTERGAWETEEVVEADAQVEFSEEVSVTTVFASSRSTLLRSSASLERRTGLPVPEEKRDVDKGGARGGGGGKAAGLSSKIHLERSRESLETTTGLPEPEENREATVEEEEEKVVVLVVSVENGGW